MNTREQMNIVVVGHVDHGKSTVVGRLLADTGSLPQGKLEQVKAMCERNARPFEYAFLLDALKDEQAQGITIDTARCFFKTKKRDYIIIDAPGHVEFLKNMVSGAARAEAALLVIDAHEGIKENSKRHGYLMSMLGIRQIVVLVNKMDLVDYKEDVFNAVVNDYSAFLKQIGVVPISFIPICARDGENLANVSDNLKWYKKSTVLDNIDAFVKQHDEVNKPFRLPVQDVYKFTEEGDDRRIIAGTVETGSISVGDSVTFYPSGKKSTITSIEAFNTPSRQTISTGYATGFTLKDELYLPRGEIMVKSGAEAPFVSTQIKASIFWMGKAPMVQGKKYKIKIATTRATVRLIEIVSSIDATDLSTSKGKKQIDRHDVAECILETTRPIAFDLISDIQSTGRFVIVDSYDIAGGGIITAKIDEHDSIVNEQVKNRELQWEKSLVSENDRKEAFGHGSKFIVFTGNSKSAILAKKLEQELIKSGRFAYYLGVANLEKGLDNDVLDDQDRVEEQLRRLGELARIMTDAGVIFITSLENIDSYDLELLSRLTSPKEFLNIFLGAKLEYAGKDTIFLDESIPENVLIQSIIIQLTERDILTDYQI
jgi:bifunctional enzyme CysN/CysC